MEDTPSRIAEERAVLIDCPMADRDRLTLDGLFRAGRDREAGVVIAPPHPLHGGSMESPVVTEIAYAAADAGVASLRFDWRGVGASTGRASGSVQDHAQDFAAALRHLADTRTGSLAAAGYSAGAAAAARAVLGAPRAELLFLVAPPPSMLDFEALARFPGRVVVVGDLDRIASADELVTRLTKHSATRVEVIPGVDHFFQDGLGELARHARRAFGTLLRVDEREL